MNLHIQLLYSTHIRRRLYSLASRPQPSPRPASPEGPDPIQFVSESLVSLRRNTQPERAMSATLISTQVARGSIPLSRTSKSDSDIPDGVPGTFSSAGTQSLLHEKEIRVGSNVLFHFSSFRSVGPIWVPRFFQHAIDPAL